MNEWVKRSIDLANSPSYLDRLAQVYPVTRETERPLSNEVKSHLRDAYEQRDEAELIKTLLKLEKFPIKDPYVAFLRKRRQEFVDLNPGTIHRLAQTVFDMGLDEVIAGCEEPKEFNRQIGALFGRWLRSLGYPFLPKQEFDRHRGIAFLEGSNGEKTDYANQVLGCRLSKGLDLLASVGGNYVIGEAKFLTDSGGHQNAQFEDALRLIRGREGRATRIAVLDGVVWIRGNTKMFRTVEGLEEKVLSALLLEDFLESLR